jgi:hypothetical protein
VVKKKKKTHFLLPAFTASSVIKPTLCQMNHSTEHMTPLQFTNKALTYLPLVATKHFSKKYQPALVKIPLTSESVTKGKAKGFLLAKR